MIELRARYLFVVLLALVSFYPCQASELGENYLSRLARIHRIPGNGDEKLLVLISDTSTELARDWSPQLARELARVFNELLNVNQNFFLVELLGPVLETRAEQFSPILDKALSDTNKKLYRELIEMDENEEKQGNG